MRDDAVTMQRWEPHDYQLDAVQFALSNGGAGLLLNPGYGKTAITLATLMVLKKQGLPHRALIVAPARVIRSVWPLERRKWIDFHSLTMSVLHGDKKMQELGAARVDPPDIILISYDGLRWALHNDLIETTARDVLVLDESTFIKDSSTVRFKTLRRMLPRFDRSMILTGTPIPQGYEDLWSQMFVLDGGKALGQFVTHYRNRYFHNVGYGAFNDWRLVAGAADLINEKIKPLVYRGDAPEVSAKMPAITYTNRVVTLPPATMRLYRELEREFEIAMEGHTFMSPTAAALSQKLRQVANGMVLSDDENKPRSRVEFHDEKIEALKEIVEELNGNPLLVLYEFVGDRDRICAAFNAPYIGGGVSNAQAALLVAGFNAGKYPVLVAHPQSAGFGLNLQETCHNVVWFGPPWSASYWEQANARVYRQGQARPVMVTCIVADGTKDMEVSRVLAGKLATQDELLAAVKM